MQQSRARESADWGADLVGDGAQVEEIAALAVAVGHGRHADDPPAAAGIATQAEPDDLADELTDLEAEPDPAAAQRDPLAGLPAQRDEFTCPVCFLVVHVSRRVGDRCSDCC